MLLSHIRSPKDIKNMNRAELTALAADIRKVIIETVAKTGGHLASNLGTVELTLALHRVFDSPQDAIVWDVSHQCYTHKLITGRFSQFSSLRSYGGLSGFAKRSESPHDYFDAGHASTSISSALGLLSARSLLNKEGRVIAVIGDGALTGGMAFEALSHAGHLSPNLIVVLNDNQMSISANTGALSRYLSKITTTASYQSFRFTVDSLVARLPFASKSLTRFISRFKRGLKGLFFQNNFFSDLGFEYSGPLDGHNIGELERAFKQVRALNRPVVLHVLTKKGLGYTPAESDPVAFHGTGPFSVSDGRSAAGAPAVSFTEVFAKAAVELARQRKDVAAITASMVKGTGLSLFAAEFKERFYDVGIAEQHALTFAAGLAAGGMLPIAAIYSTFMQRAVDQLIHDIAIPAAPLILAMDRAGAVPDDGETHQGIFDIAIMRAIPNLILTAPASEAELRLLFFWAAERKAPVALRYPKASCPPEEAAFSEPIREGRGVLVKKGDHSDLLLVCTGGIFAETAEASRLLKARQIGSDIYNLRFIKPLDDEFFLLTAASYRAVLCVEDGVLSGGIGEYLFSLLASRGIRARALGFPQSFIPQGKRADILSMAGLSAADIARAAEELL